VIYCLIAFSAVGIKPWYELAESPVPLTLVAREVMGVAGGLIMNAAAIVATLSSLSAAMLGGARIAYALSRDGYFPKAISKLDKKYKSPYMAIILSSILVMLFSGSGVVKFVGYASDFGLLAGLTLVNYSVVWMRRKMPRLNRPFRVPLYPIMPILGSVSSMIMIPMLHKDVLVLGTLLGLVGILAYHLVMVGLQRIRVAVGGMNLLIATASFGVFASMRLGYLPPVFLPPEVCLALDIVLILVGFIHLMAGILNIRA